jgi:hypothetical protein
LIFSLKVYRERDDIFAARCYFPFAVRLTAPKTLLWVGPIVSLSLGGGGHMNETKVEADELKEGDSQEDSITQRK